LPQNPKTAWGQSTRIEQNYNRSLQQLRRQIVSQLQGATTTEEISRRLRVIQNSPQFISFAENMAANMAQQVYRESGTQWRRQAQEANRRRSRAIFEALQNELSNTPMGGQIQDIVINNSNLIKTIPNRLDAQMASIMAKESAYAGMRADQLAQNLLGQFDNLLEYQARCIARTETAKAQAALTQTRAQNLGINWYVWRTAQDGMRVRYSHRHMEGVLIAWGNPPNPESLKGQENSHGPYHAGNIWNCRCYTEPLIDIDWIEWPHKVYIGGTIQMMSREQFVALEADPLAYNSNQAAQPNVNNNGLDAPNQAIISNDPIENALNTQKGNPMETTEANVGANPNFNQGFEYQVNCQRCVPAFELRKRGFNVTAKPKPPNNTINTSVNCFDTSLTWVQGRADLMKQLNAFPDGARFGIRHGWAGTKKNSAGHTYVAVKENGVIRFIDPQTGSLDCSNYLTRAKRGTMAFFRMDNIAFKPGLDLNDIVEVMR